MAGLPLQTKDEIVQGYERNYVLRVPGAKTGKNTLVGQDARQAADIVVPFLAEAQRLSKLPALDGLTSVELEDEAEALGLDRRLPAVGASGFVEIATATGGATISAGDALTNTVTGKRYAAAIGGVYADGAQVSIYGIDIGPDTNVDAGTVLQWTSPAPGLDPNATVVEQSDGTGLDGGSDEETDDGIKARINDAYANQAAAGNDAAYRKAALKCPGLSVEAAWTYPCILGPGTIGLVFTLRPAQPGASRIPNGTQIAAMAAWLAGQFPYDDSLFVGTLVAVPTLTFIRMRWAQGASGWTDATPWPPYNASHFTVSASPTPTATSFRIASAMGSPPNPQVGQTIGFWDAANGAFRRKRILTVSGSASPWDITCDTSLNASDTTYTPATGDVACPWSDSLDTAAAVIVSEFDGLGPGEQVASFFDIGGMRERRGPTATATPFSCELTGRTLTPMFDLVQVDDAQIVEPSLPAAPSAGTPGVSSNLLTLQAPLFYPL